MTLVFLYCLFHGYKVEDTIIAKLNLLNFALAFFSVPVIGIIISTIGLGIIYMFRGHRIFFYIPDGTTTEGEFIIEKVLGENRRNPLANTLLTGLNETGTVDWNKEDRIRRFFIMYQHPLREE
jgi:hypothetical protein